VSDDIRDEEEIFWERFFERLQPVREAGQKILNTLDSSPIGNAFDQIEGVLNKVSRRGHSIGQRLAEFWYATILRSPGIIIVSVLLFSVYFVQESTEFEHQIDGDVEVYLPDDAESTDLLKEVRSQWATDIMILYFQTDNAIHKQCAAGEAPPNCRGSENITSAEILRQMSWLEGDDENRMDGGWRDGLDTYKDDRGAQDGIIWILSPAQIIKETNSSSFRFTCAFEKYGLPTGQSQDCALAQLNPYRGYSIPDDQERIDNLVDQTESLLSGFVMDTQDHPLLDENNDGIYDNDGDGIWDTGVVVIGLDYDMNGADPEISRSDPKDPRNRIQDHQAFIEYAKRLIFDESDLENCKLCKITYDETMSSSINTEIYSLCTKQNPNDPQSKCVRGSTNIHENEAINIADSKPQRQPITVTGLTPVVHDVSDEIYDELVDTMLPISAILVCITMLVLHRNPKVIIICGLPIAISLAVTFGITVVRNWTLTPMIISAGPILVGLGVDYALHLTNRIEENRQELIEENLEENWQRQRDGLETYEIDPWDPVISLTATVRAALTTGHAIFLSAITTIIGFSVLAWPMLVSIYPMRTVGKTLVLGIAVTFLISMIIVPALVHLLRYRKSKSVIEMPPFQTLIFSIIVGSLATGALIYAGTTTIGNSLFFGAFSAVTLVLALESTIWDKIGKIPVRMTLVVILVTSFVTIAGVVILEEEMGKPLTGSSDEVPPNIPSYDALREYSFIFQGGQTNMFIVDAETRGAQNSTAPIRDLPILDSIDRMQERKINNVPQTDSISLVNILKAVHVDVNASGIEIYDRSLWELLHDECWEESTNPLRPECWPYAVSSKEDMVNVALDTLSPEIRSMLMNDDQDVCGGGSPCETKTLVYVTQPYINLLDATPLREAIDDHLEGKSDGQQVTPQCQDALTCYALNIDGVVNSKLTGGLPVSIDINSGIQKAQSQTTIATMIILLFTMMILFRSPRLATFTMAAVAVVVLWQPLLMRQGSVNVNFFTAMIGTLVFGIGVDDSIHIVDRIKDERETPAGIVKSVSRTGQTIFETTATTCAGLSAGLFVAIPGLQNFFVLMMSLLILALLTSSILLPSLIVIWHELRSRLLGFGPWLDYDDSGALETSTVLEATLE
tara:strand:+ start:13148 stop:16552 length:3405 start_codon:yes stop_codon:yes gene_type:complete